MSLGGPTWERDLRGLRDRDTSAAMLAPRIEISGPFITKQAIGDFSFWTADDRGVAEIATPEEARRLVAEQADLGVELIKLGFEDTPMSPLAPRLDALTAAIDEAREIAAHARLHVEEMNGGDRLAPRLRHNGAHRRFRLPGAIDGDQYFAHGRSPAALRKRWPAVRGRAPACRAPVQPTRAPSLRRFPRPAGACAPT